MMEFILRLLAENIRLRQENIRLKQYVLELDRELQGKKLNEYKS